MGTHKVVLTKAQSDLVERLVASGRFRDAGEALRAGVRLLEREEAETEGIRDRLRMSLAQARAGDLADGSGEAAIRRAFAKARGED